MTEPYRVVTRWDGRQWMVRVEDADGFHIGQTTARRLMQVEAHAHRVITSELNHRSVVGEPVELMVDLQLHRDVEEGFRVAEDLVADASSEVQANVEALQAAGMAAQDIAVLVAVRELTAGHAAPWWRLTPRLRLWRWTAAPTRSRLVGTMPASG